MGLGDTGLRFRVRGLGFRASRVRLRFTCEVQEVYRTVV